MKSRKLVKILGASGLAIMMGIGTLCGVLIAPMNSTHANTSANATTETALTPEAQAKAELDANILAGGGLGLDPENDPIVATTDWGLDIYFHNAGEGTWKNPSADGSVSTTALKGYNYFLGGTYGGVSLKWVIIGYSTNTVSASPVNPNNVSNSTVFPDTTDAGSLIKTYAGRGLVYVNSYKLSAYTNAVGTTEIPAGCVLCISEKNLLNGIYQNAYSANAGDGYQKGVCWKYSDLRTTMDNLFKTSIASFDTIRGKIQEVELSTYSYRWNISSSSSVIYKDISKDHFFTLANSTYYHNDAVHWNPSSYPQTYLVETYLGATYSNSTDRAKRISYAHNSTNADYWWLRSGISDYYGYNSPCLLHSDGMISSTSGNTSYGVRPAFVLKL